MNIATIVIILLIATGIIYAIRTLKKNGGHSCSGCSECTGCQYCNEAKK